MRVQQEMYKLNKQRKFGLVFEEHTPENTFLYDVPVKRGALVAKRENGTKDTYVVVSIDGDNVVCEHSVSHEQVTMEKDEVVVVAQLGDPIYPYLKPMGSVQNAPDSELWHTLIEADNYHALQLLAYLYPGMVDCIYIDPPYNSGARDWKYNNDYVDGNDTYKHSKWLSMIEKRLLLAKKLLNPNDSVLIVTIDEKEYLHLGCLLEQTFPNTSIQMVSSVINPTGTQRPNSFNRTDEYLFFVRIGDCRINPIAGNTQMQEVDWRTFRRQGSDNLRPTRPNQFYPIYVNDEKHTIVEVGEPIAPDVDRFSVKAIPGCTTVFPIKDDGTEMMWSTEPDETRRRLKGGYIRVESINKTNLNNIYYNICIRGK